MERPLQVFCCYARTDQEYLYELKKHLIVLERENLLEVKADIDILPGAEWEREIDHHLENAQIILLLITTNFIASNYCYEKEMQQALRRHEQGTACVIPIIIRPSSWKNSPLGKLQALPKDAKPISTWNNNDEAYINIIDGIRAAIQAMYSLTKKMSDFEEKYRREIAHKLNVVELVGADIATPSLQHKLNVAYVTLSVKQKYDHSSLAPPLGTAKRLPDDLSMSVYQALMSPHHLLIHGPAGSGKTTLLYWIAVHSASRSFIEDLSDWNYRIPFYIRLRQYAQSGLPAPEDFVTLAMPDIAAVIPQGWVEKELKSGQAVVLIDGLDEISELQRESVRQWLQKLIVEFSASRFIVTSRSYAVKDDWNNLEGFNHIELQPMDLSSINTFIDYWHKSVAEELKEIEKKKELLNLAQNLKEIVLFDRIKRLLASNPLLCAMLCALNQERKSQLPTDRIELYDACLQLLVERRDKERSVSLVDYPAAVLRYRQKLALLQDLAYWLVKNERTEMASQNVDELFSRNLLNMQILPDLSGSQVNLSGSHVRKLFLERTSIIREPIVGQIDFTHRTFQEFLAAQAAIDDGDEDSLIENAHNDGWREVIILAAGLATKAVRKRLIRGLISRGDRESTHRYQLHLLAVACLETTIDHLSPDLKNEVENRLRELIPPKNMEDAKALSSAKELAVPHLGRRKDFSPSVAAACVRALALIAGDAALEILKSYSEDEQKETIDELLNAWSYFDREKFASEILLRSLRHTTCLSLENLPSLDGIQYFTQLRTLKLVNCQEPNGLERLASLVQLNELSLSGGSQVHDLLPLRSLTELTHLDLSHCKHIDDFSAIKSLKHLQSLDLSYCSQISDLRFLESLTKIKSLDLSSCPQIHNLSPLASLAQLTQLDLSGCDGVTDLTPLKSLVSLDSLILYRCEGIKDLTPLTSLTQLRSLNLYYCESINDLRQLENLIQINYLIIARCNQTIDLTFLSNLTGLTLLDLSFCSQLNDLTFLINLSELKSLNLSGCRNISDIAPLAQLTKLNHLSLSGCDGVTDLTPLASLEQLNSLDVSRCEHLTSIEPLAGLLEKQLIFLDTSGSSHIKDRSLLKALGQKLLVRTSRKH